jgi:hypothetical protein
VVRIVRVVHWVEILQSAEDAVAELIVETLAVELVPFERRDAGVVDEEACDSAEFPVITSKLVSGQNPIPLLRHY